MMKTRHFLFLFRILNILQSYTIYRLNRILNINNNKKHICSQNCCKQGKVLKKGHLINESFIMALPKNSQGLNYELCVIQIW